MTDYFSETQIKIVLGETNLDRIKNKVNDCLSRGHTHGREGGYIEISAPADGCFRK